MKYLVTFASLVLVAASAAGDWTKLPALPDAEGFAGCFAGVSGGSLVVAGGANFPWKRPWEGGTKVWYDTVFVLDSSAGTWKVAGKLPRPLGYGVSLTHGGGVVCVGGSNAERHHSDAFRLDWKAGQLTIRPLPPLPVTLANASGALAGETLYVAGGQETSDATAAVKAAWSIDLAAAEPKWTAIEPWPGRGRMLAVAAGCDGAFWLAGGVDLVRGADGKPERVWLKDAFRYDPGKGWTRLADLPTPVTAAPSPAPVVDGGFLILGGDDGAQVAAAPASHRGFPKTILRYDIPSRTWVAAGETPAPRVTVPCVRWNDAWVIPSGEIRPGVRSPEVWSFKPGSTR